MTAADFAVQLGTRVALVEKDRLGGDCTWTGCVPSKTLLKAAKVAHQMRTAGRYGLPTDPFTVDLAQVMSHVRSVIDEIYEEEDPKALREKGIDVFLSAARFTGPHTIAVGDDQLAASHVLIATGARPFLPPIDGIDTINALTSDTIWALDQLPEHLVVVGAGPVGCEMAQAFRRLGTRVTLLSSHDQILPRDDPAAAQVLARVFATEGVDVRLNARAERVWKDEDGIHVIAGGDDIVGDRLFFATGRRPNVDGLGLDSAGVDYTAQGIEVDNHLRTSQHHIYAAGDCLGGYQFTHYAGWQAFVAVRNALLPGASTGITNRVPWTTFTDPEVAQVGLTETQAREQRGDDVMTCQRQMAQSDRARTEHATDGFVKLVHKSDGTLLGATIVAERAGEMLHEWIVALENDLKIGDVADLIHVYPTYATANQLVAAAIRVEQVLNNPLVRLARKVL